MHRYCYIVVINLSDFRVSDPVPVETIQKIIIIKKQVAFKCLRQMDTHLGSFFFVCKPTLLINFAA